MAQGYGVVATLWRRVVIFFYGFLHAVFHRLYNDRNDNSRNPFGSHKNSFTAIQKRTQY